MEGVKFLLVISPSQLQLFVAYHREVYLVLGTFAHLWYKEQIPHVWRQFFNIRWASGRTVCYGPEAENPGHRFWFKTTQDKRQVVWWFIQKPLFKLWRDYTRLLKDSPSMQSPLLHTKQFQTSQTRIQNNQELQTVKENYLNLPKAQKYTVVRHIESLTNGFWHSNHKAEAKIRNLAKDVIITAR